MTPLFNIDPATQHARNWSALLGTLAAQNDWPAASTSSHRPAILDLIRRHMQREHVDHKIKAHAFIMAN
jgi:hypothetical protein